MSDLRVIAIDGPAGSGKSTVARGVADRLELSYLDTGAMYRAVACAALRRGVDPADAGAVVEVARTIDLELTRDTCFVDGVDATAEIRGPEVTGAVSVVAANPGVRTEMVARQRAWATERGGGVMEGRDIGSVVFPDATLKVYLTASAAVRAKRRAGEAGGQDVAAVGADIERRDAADSGREMSPLVEAPGAVVVDTSDLGIDEVVDLVVGMLP